MPKLLNKLSLMSILLTLICSAAFAEEARMPSNKIAAALVSEAHEETDASEAENPLRDLLQDLLLQASRARVFSMPRNAELKQAAQLFTQILKAPPASDAANLAKQANALQMEIVKLGDVIILKEQATAQRGRGFYVFRHAKQWRDILQVPHSFTDEMTRPIGLSLFAEGPFAAVAFNTVPRRFLDANGNQVNADMAHLEGTYFLEFAKAAALAHPQGNSVQIHGFSQTKRKSAALAESDIILSAGHKQAPLSLQAGQKKLESNLQRNVILYADTIKELGATTNVQASALRAQGYQNFIHVEMSRPMREKMRSSAKTRRQLLRSILPNANITNHALTSPSGATQSKS